MFEMHITNTLDLINFTIKNGDPTYLYFWSHRQKNTNEIDKSCLSQWYPAPFQLEDITYRTAEHYMMAQKALIFNDVAINNQILESKHPKDVKELGRLIKNFIPAVWEAERARIVFQGNLAKFSQNALLRDFLFATGESILVEASPVDPIWGVGLAANDTKILSPANWEGLNLLGYALMKVRAQLRLNIVSRS